MHPLAAIGLVFLTGLGWMTTVVTLLVALARAQARRAPQTGARRSAEDEEAQQSENIQERTVVAGELPELNPSATSSRRCAQRTSSASWFFWRVLPAGNRVGAACDKHAQAVRAVGRDTCFTEA